jgi:hypothetical protein
LFANNVSREHIAASHRLRVPLAPDRHAPDFARAWTGIEREAG